jgi:hypothetical protein
VGVAVGSSDVGLGSDSDVGLVSGTEVAAVVGEEMTRVGVDSTAAIIF